MNLRRASFGLGYVRDRRARRRTHHRVLPRVDRRREDESSHSRTSDRELRSLEAGEGNSDVTRSPVNDATEEAVFVQEGGHEIRLAFGVAQMLPPRRRVSAAPAAPPPPCQTLGATAAGLDSRQSPTARRARGQYQDPRRSQLLSNLRLVGPGQGPIKELSPMP